MAPNKKHVVLLTEQELKALANIYRVCIKEWGELPYVQQLQSDGGSSGFDVLMKKIKEINSESERQ